MRLFAALPIPTDVARALVPLQARLPGASWRPAEGFHITLRFFGELDHHLARDLDLEIARIEARQFPLDIEGTGWFGKHEPTAVWARVRAHEPLERLAAACERAARRLGLPAERRRFTPHITLAYCHGTSLAEAMAWCERHGDLRLGPFQADRFHLYSSHSGRGPSHYVAEADYPLS